MSLEGKTSGRLETDAQVEPTAERPNTLLRRTLLKASVVGAGAIATSGATTASDNGANEDDADQGTQVNQAEGFKTEVVAPHATFPDDVAVAYDVTYEDGAEESVSLGDTSTVVIVRARFEPGGTSGWHSDQGPALVTVVEGEVDVTFENGYVTRTYAAGEAVTITGKHADLLENASDTEPAMAYVIFFGVPAGEPPSNPVEPPDC